MIALPDRGQVSTANSEVPGGFGYGALFARANRKRTALVSLPWFLMDIATYGVGLFTPVILAAMHFG